MQFEKLSWRLWFSIVISIIIHILIFWMLSGHPIPHQPKSQSKQAFTVILSPIDQISSTTPSTATDPANDSSPAFPDQPLPSSTQQHASHTPSNMHHETPQTTHDPTSHPYYGSREIDRRALPIGSIDVDQLGHDILIDGIPLRMRIYVDELGTVKKIERLAVMEQDQELASKIEQLLLSMPFIPAKKGGNDVSSYQDVEFSFQPFDSSPVLPVSPEGINVNHP